MKQRYKKMRSATAARAEDATKWLLSRLEAENQPAEVIATVERLLLTEGGVRAIETARMAVETAETARNGETAMNSRMDTRARACATALERYTIAASNNSTTHALARVCASLGMGENAGDYGARLDAISGVASGVLRSRAEVTKAQAHQRAAATEARVCARAYAAAQRAGAALRGGSERRGVRAAKAWDRVAVLDAKTAEYDVAAKARKEVVRSSGVDVNCTHEAVAKWAKQMRALKRANEADVAAAEGYLDLPPDLHMAKEKVRLLREEVAELDGKMQDALSDFV